ncbi:hypothetical protein RCG23_10700 [Neobacillus sp. PS3-34]|uniref:hypothetical protein n=1 Tax=Neobacillus sp. PS3-34 TaxID=3070678 RepID=UPI0027E0B65C|nr:hypothetical protein [Neobacillus sp. PS3-34]WML50225.1 hypothetical protein RCG23_10700 [Neobacillus sp. PS3-34]
MFPTFNDFIDAYPKYQKFSNSLIARDVYGFLSHINNIYRMITANNNGKNALYGVLNDLESRFGGKSDFDFLDGFVKQCVGTMIKFILLQFGYEKNIQKDMPRGSFIYFTSAMSYQKKHAGRFKLVQTLSIEPFVS